MSQYNLGSLSSSNTAIQVVAAGDPPTLILNHSTKNSIYIGTSNAVGSGNLLDATPLDPYASIVVDGTVSVWAVAAVQTLPATVYTYQNAINWSPKAIQPNIVDSTSPYFPGIGTHNTILTVPPEAQGLNVSWGNPLGFTGLIVTGSQSGIVYATFDPQTTTDQQIWIPILSDADTTVTVSTTATSAPRLYLVWIMTPFMAGMVETGQLGDVNIANVTVAGGFVPVQGNVGITGSVTSVFSHIDDRSLASNQEPVNFNISLAAGATTVLLPASAGVQYFLHDIWCQINSGDMLSFHVQDTNANDLGTFINIITGTPTNTYRPANPPFDFKGSPIPIGIGIQLKNGGAATETFVGSLTYSK